MSTGVVLLAAGSGRRFGSKIPKPFLRLNGEPLFFTSLRTFAAVRSVSHIVVVVAPTDKKFVEKLLGRLRVRPVLSVVAGGAFRGRLDRRSAWLDVDQGEEAGADARGDRHVSEGAAAA